MAALVSLFRCSLFSNRSAVLKSPSPSRFSHFLFSIALIALVAVLNATAEPLQGGETLQGGAGTYADPHWYQWTTESLGVGSGFYSKRGQTKTSTTAFKDANDNVTQSHEVNGKALFNSTCAQTSEYNDMKKYANDPKWYKQNIEGLTNKLVEYKITLKLDNNGNFRSLLHGFDDESSTLIGAPAYDANNKRIDDVVASKGSYVGAVAEMNSAVSGKVSCNTDKMVNNVHDQMYWSFSFDTDAGPDGEWDFHYHFFHQDIAGSYSGDWGFYPPAIGTSLGTFADESFGNGLASRCGGLQPKFVFESVTDAQDLLNFIQQFPSPLTFSFAEWDNDYIMHVYMHFT